MRLAGSDEIYKSLADGFDVDDSSVDKPIDKFESFMSTYELLVSKGFSEQAAEKTAIAMVEGKEPMAQPTLRFAQIYGDTPKDTRASSQPD